MTWTEFVIAYGRHAPVHHLAAVVGQPEAAIMKLRNRGVCAPGPRRTFGKLFPLYHGRAPRDDEWPAPRRAGAAGYEWLAPELKLLATLTGTVGTDEICRVLTARLRQLTGDPHATRNSNAVNTGRQRTGVWTADVVGGLTANQAGRSIGCISIVYNDIRHGRLKTQRVGRHLVIPHDEWARWKAARVFPPAGFVSLSTLKRPLGITSDKLSEWARMGYVPSAIRCNPYGTRAASTKFGTWYIDPKVRKKLIADRRAGRPMPWWRRPEPHNLKVTYRLWQARQHPVRCETCRTIWGASGAPTTYESYVERYPPLAFGAKRHLTRRWRAVTKRRAAARRPWISVDAAAEAYGFLAGELMMGIVRGQLTSKLGEAGAMRGIYYVLREQVRDLREREGWSADVVAARFGISVDRLHALAATLEWRATDRLTLGVINGIRKRLESAAGQSIAAAARTLGKSVAWVEREIANGTARVLRTPFSTRRYLSAPMLERLRQAARHPQRRERWTSEWLLVSDAALVAGVCATRVQRWADAGEVAIRMKKRFRRYHRRSVMTRARQYWATEVRYKRAVSPAWLQAKTEDAA